MDESSNWASRPSIQSQHGQRSYMKNMASSPPSTTHHRIASDGVPLTSRSLPNNTFGYTRPSSISLRSREWLPIMGATRPASPSVTTSIMNWQDDGDLGSQSFTIPSNLTLDASNRHQKPGSFYKSSELSRAPRPRPAPMQFEDAPMDHQSPVTSSQSIFSPRDRFQYSRTDSRASLLNTPSTVWRSPRTPPPYCTMMSSPRKWWHWRPAWFMYLSFLFGVACAIGHHVFYTSLNGKPAVDQLAMLRYGTVLSFSAKAGLVAAVVIAFKQRIWTTVRSKFLSVAALDSLFAAAEDASALLNIEIYKQAKIAMLLAAFVWLTPIVIILTSNTLTMELALSIENTACSGIRTLNFTKDELEEWRNPTKSDNLYGLSMSIWNTTASDTASPDWFDYYASPSNPLIRVATHAAFMGQAVSKSSINIDICGSGWNCTYTINFTAPAYKCSELASGVGSEIKTLGNQKPPDGLSTKLLVPEGDYSYYAYTSGGEYSTQQMKDTSPGGIPNMEPPFPEALGAFRTEPVIWIGYSVRTNPNEVPPLNRSMPGWSDAFIPKVIGCEHYETDYTVLFNLTGGQQITKVTERKFQHRIIDTTWIQGTDANDGTNDNTTARPKSNYIYPRNVRKYRRVAAFHAMGFQLREFLNGTMNSAQLNNPIGNTKADQTRLLDPRHDYFAFPTLVNLVQELYEDMIISLFSNGQFLSVVWAAKSDVMSGTGAGDESTKYPCVRSRLDTLAILENEGVLRSTRFSSIVAATRGPALEKLGWVGEDRGNLPQDIKNLKVGYGIVHRMSGLEVLQEDTRYPERRVWDGGDVHMVSD
ncbi:uncharacterized protein F4817DRAFT_346189 [Daldinia loculata]|uniref:uncharacterized protein n=1 Tax=Daldinia loculata TaxID=103429 RepID=UPI0020C3005E|nr:uncharacterized protein F4817DRAFT_346189 [Daldinia loculata]KAI1644588.1 hypothetical protein F4817DRAFT_346189 [Daldinia loculata]